MKLKILMSRASEALHKVIELFEKRLDRELPHPINNQ